MPLHNIYLDYNATTPAFPEVITCMTDVMAKPFNASSVHQTGRKAANILEEARQQLANALGARHARVIFTATGTEANNLALNGLEGYAVAVSSIEHVSVLAAAPRATILPVDEKGVIDFKQLENFAKAHEGKSFLVSVMWANNETGVFQPVREIADIIHKYSGLFHCDASQALGKLPVNMLESGADMMTVSAHKMGGPQGAAALVITKCAQLKAQTVGGGQESGFRAGTHNLAAIAGFGKAAEYAAERERAMQHVKLLRDGLEAALPDAIVIGADSPRLPNTSCIAMPGVTYDTQLIHFDLNGIAISSGSACSSGKVGESHVLKAMRVNEGIANCAIRVSLGLETTQEELEIFIRLWNELYQRNNTQQKAA